MYECLQRDIDYVIRVDEILWGCALLALTLIVRSVSGFFALTRRRVFL
jgi:hypothetical protein